ncbi:MAG: hypothetical protein EXS08_16230 [Planctomycetes bacterium]|nr:hypothetical protein [Planctomycetota bacterium]
MEGVALVLLGLLSHSAGATVAGCDALRAQEELARLTMDELLARLPAVGEEWTYAGARRHLVPVAQELRQRLDRGERLDAGQWQRALLDTGVLGHRERWPVDLPFTVSLQEAGWFEGHVLELEPAEPGPLSSASVGTPPGVTCGLDLMRHRERAAHQELGHLELGAHRLAFDVVQGAPFYAAWPARVPGALVLDVEIVATLDEAIPPVSSPALDAAVRRALFLAREETRAGPQIFLCRRIAAGAPDELAHVAVELEVELRHAGQVSAHARLPEGVGKTPVPLPAALATALAAAPPREQGWSLRVRGVAADVLERWWFERRWGGEFELPLEAWWAAR